MGTAPECVSFTDTFSIRCSLSNSQVLRPRAGFMDRRGFCEVCIRSSFRVNYAENCIQSCPRWLHGCIRISSLRVYFRDRRCDNEEPGCSMAPSEHLNSSVFITLHRQKYHKLSVNNHQCPSDDADSFPYRTSAASMMNDPIPRRESTLC